MSANWHKYHWLLSQKFVHIQRLRNPVRQDFYTGYGMFLLWFNELLVIYQWITIRTRHIPYENACSTGFGNLSNITTIFCLLKQKANILLPIQWIEVTACGASRTCWRVIDHNCTLATNKRSRRVAQLCLIIKKKSGWIGPVSSANLLALAYSMLTLIYNKAVFATNHYQEGGCNPHRFSMKRVRWCCIWYLCVISVPSIHINQNKHNN